MKEGMLKRKVMKAWNMPITVPRASAMAVAMNGASALAPSAAISPIRLLLMVAQTMARKE